MHCAVTRLHLTFVPIALPFRAYRQRQLVHHITRRQCNPRRRRCVASSLNWIGYLRGLPARMIDPFSPTTLGRQSTARPHFAHIPARRICNCVSGCRSRCQAPDTRAGERGVVQEATQKVLENFRAAPAVRHGNVPDPPLRGRPIAFPSPPRFRLACPYPRC